VHLGRATRTQRRRRRQARSDVEGAGGHGNVGELCSRAPSPRKRKGGENVSLGALAGARRQSRASFFLASEPKKSEGGPRRPRAERGGGPPSVYRRP
jgi:hypothetical protein